MGCWMPYWSQARARHSPYNRDERQYRDRCRHFAVMSYAHVQDHRQHARVVRQRDGE